MSKAALLLLTIPLTIEVMDKGKKVKTLKVEIREFTKKEITERQKEFKKQQNLLLKLESLESKQTSLERKVVYSEKLKKWQDALEFQEKLDVVKKELSDFVNSEEISSADELAEKTAKKNFDLLVSGKDKKELAEIADSKGYGFVMKLLQKTKVDTEGKQDEE